MSLVKSGKNGKNIYKLSDDLYTYGMPGEFGPRVERYIVRKDRATRGRPAYRRVPGGVIPPGLKPEVNPPMKVMEELLLADKTAQA